MQAIAREFNFPETTFACPSAGRPGVDRPADAHLHPRARKWTLQDTRPSGTALVLASLGRVALSGESWCRRSGGGDRAGTGPRDDPSGGHSTGQLVLREVKVAESPDASPVRADAARAALTPGHRGPRRLGLRASACRSASSTSPTGQRSTPQRSTIRRGRPTLPTPGRPTSISFPVTSSGTGGYTPGCSPQRSESGKTPQPDPPLLRSRGAPVTRPPRRSATRMAPSPGASNT